MLLFVQDLFGALVFAPLVQCCVLYLKFGFWTDSGLLDWSSRGEFDVPNLVLARTLHSLNAAS